MGISSMSLKFVIICIGTDCYLDKRKVYLSFTPASLDWHSSQGKVKKVGHFIIVIVGVLT